MANVRIRFIDGETMDGESDDVSSSRLGFAMRPSTGNNRLAWIPFSALKLCMFNPAGGQATRLTDPRAQAGLPKLVLRFNDGEAMRGYKDEVFSYDGNCVNVMLWDEATKGLRRFIVPYSALKAIFFVDEFDSRKGIEHTA
jgi:hypothetical protein